MRSDFAFLFLRLVMGSAFVLHGLPKMQHPTTWAAGALPGAPPWLQLIAALAEFLGGAMLAIGFLTPLFALLIACNMLVAIFVVLVPHGATFVASGTAESFELPLTYLALAFLFVACGPGRFSVDALVRRPRTTRNRR